ncbi:hypothetical protein BJ165DRAFT_1598401 [Panaeolus papilionaceus]|nr:hypothetical protein BJ165DRAFT_1598401 [Panaeolus papilionaceus]
MSFLPFPDHWCPLPSPGGTLDGTLHTKGSLSGFSYTARWCFEKGNECRKGRWRGHVLDLDDDDVWKKSVGRDEDTYESESEMRRCDGSKVDSRSIVDTFLNMILPPISVYAPSDWRQEQEELRRDQLSMLEASSKLNSNSAVITDTILICCPYALLSLVLSRHPPVLYYSLSSRHPRDGPSTPVNITLDSLKVPKIGLAIYQCDKNGPW